MKKLLLLSFSILLYTNISIAQSKKELRAEVADLKRQVEEKDQALSEARQNEKISVANAAEFEAQVSELQDANATLLTNIKTLTEATAQRSDNISRTLESIRQKEAQLKVVNDEISAYDSIAFIVLSNFKKTLGEDALIGVQKDALTVELSEVGLFGTNSNTSLPGEGKNYVNKISAAVMQHQGTAITLHVTMEAGSSSDLIKARAASIVSTIQESLSPDIQKVALKYSQGSVRSYRLSIHPDWSAFYLKVRDAVKNSG